MKKSIVLGMLLSFILVCGVFVRHGDMSVSDNFYSESNPVNRNAKALYSPHDAITITADSNFADQGWSGDGSENSPYLIQNLEITSNEYCISIKNTGVHFEIIDCYLVPNDSNYGIGVILDNVENGTIIGCEFRDFKTGIAITDSSNCIVSNNELSNCYEAAIDSDTVSDCDFSYNDIHDADGEGIHISDSDNTTVSFNDVNATMFSNIRLIASNNCSIYNNSIGVSMNWGLVVVSSNDILIANNSHYDEFYGMRLENSMWCTLTQNEFEKVGLWIRGTEKEHFITNTFDSNRVEGKPITVLKNRSSEIIDASPNGQLFLFNSNACIVTGGEFDNRGVGVSLASCNDSIVWNLNSVYNQISLVEFQVCYDSLIKGCNINGSFNAGFRVLYSVNCTVTECNLGKPHTSSCGVDIYHSENVTITQNTFRSTGVWGYSNEGCNIENNDMSGHSGSRLRLMKNSTFQGNNVHDIWNDGILIFKSSNLTIIDNEIHDIGGYGIMIHNDVMDIRVYNNSFWENYRGNALDNGTDNYWDDGVSLGNRWDDYSAPGYYLIPGSAESIDHYPILLPDSFPPTITGPSDYFFSVGDGSSLLTWFPNDKHPDRYELLLNGSVIDSGDWNGETISYEITNDVAGIFNYTLIVYDSSSNYAVDNVIVTVYNGTTTSTDTSSTPTDTTPTDPPTEGNWGDLLPLISFIITIGSVMVVIVIAILIFRAKK